MGGKLLGMVIGRNVFVLLWFCFDACDTASAHRHCGDFEVDMAMTRDVIAVGRVSRKTMK